MHKKISQIINSKFTEYFLLTVILIVGLVVRLYRINNPIADWHSWRQADTASVAKIYVENGINLLLPKYHDISSIQTGIFNPMGYRMVEFPIYSAIHATIAKSFTSISLEMWGRLLSSFLTILSGYLLYLIGKKLLGKWGGLISGFLYLVLPFNIYFTRVILPEPFGVFCALLGMWLFMLFIDSEKKYQLYISAIFLALSLLIKPFFGFYMLPLAYLFYEKYGLKSFKDLKFWSKYLLFLLITFTPLFLWRFWVSHYPEGIPFFEWAFNGDRIRFHPAFWKWIFGERIGHLILGSWGLIPLVLGMLKIRQKGEYFINYFLLGVFFYVSIVATANVRHDYYQIIIIPALALGLSQGLLYLWNESTLNKYLGKIIAVMSVVVMILTAYPLIKDNYNINHPEILEVGSEVDNLIPKDALIVAPYNGDTAFLYATNRHGWPAVDNSIENIIDEGADYYVSIDLGSADTKKFESMFETVKKTDRYILLDLHKTIGISKK